MPTRTDSAFAVRTPLATPGDALKRTLAVTILLSATLFGASTANAATYTIQIGAFKTPSAQFADSARRVGDVFATQRDSGVIALSVGSFQSSDEANEALSRIEQDYPGAFVRRANPEARRAFASGDAASSARPATTKPARSVASSSASDTSNVLATLSPSERKHAVYLDGVLRFKLGDQFLTLPEYRARSR